MSGFHLGWNSSRGWAGLNGLKAFQKPLRCREGCEERYYALNKAGGELIHSLKDLAKKMKKARRRKHLKHFFLRKSTVFLKVKSK